MTVVRCEANRSSDSNPFFLNHWLYSSHFWLVCWISVSSAIRDTCCPVNTGHLVYTPDNWSNGLCCTTNKQTSISDSFWDHRPIGSTLFPFWQNPLANSTQNSAFLPWNTCKYGHFSLLQQPAAKNEHIGIFSWLTLCEYGQFSTLHKPRKNLKQKVEKIWFAPDPVEGKILTKHSEIPKTRFFVTFDIWTHVWHRVWTCMHRHAYTGRTSYKTDNRLFRLLWSWSASCVLYGWLLKCCD